MIRTQVQLTEEQVKVLHALSASTGRSTAELIRNSVDQFIAGRRVETTTDKWERARVFVGQFASDGSDVSVDHDRYLDEIYGDWSGGEE